MYWLSILFHKERRMAQYYSSFSSTLLECSRMALWRLGCRWISWFCSKAPIPPKSSLCLSTAGRCYWVFQKEWANCWLGIPPGVLIRRGWSGESCFLKVRKARMFFCRMMIAWLFLALSSRLAFSYLVLLRKAPFLLVLNSLKSDMVRVYIIADQDFLERTRSTLS